MVAYSMAPMARLLRRVSVGMCSASRSARCSTSVRRQRLRGQPFELRAPKHNEYCERAELVEGVAAFIQQQVIPPARSRFAIIRGLRIAPWGRLFSGLIMLAEETIRAPQQHVAAVVAASEACRVQVAEYIGVSPSTFDKNIADGEMPAPKRIRGRVVWDRKQVDRAFGCIRRWRGKSAMD